MDDVEWKDPSSFGFGIGKVSGWYVDIGTEDLDKMDEMRCESIGFALGVSQVCIGSDKMDG